jgi:hypothetical protein
MRRIYDAKFHLISFVQQWIQPCIVSLQSMYNVSASIAFQYLKLSNNTEKFEDYNC